MITNIVSAEKYNVIINAKKIVTATISNAIPQYFNILPIIDNREH